MKNINTKLNIMANLIVIFFVLFVAIPASASTITKDRVIQMVNQSRAEQGYSVLQENEKLSRAAELKINDMIVNNYFAHTSPAGLSPWHWFSKTNYEYHYAGENLAMNFRDVERQHSAWMASPTHRKNILNANYTEIGVAVREGAVGGKNTIIVVQEFGSPLGFIPVNAQERVNGEQVYAPIIPPMISENIAAPQAVKLDVKGQVIFMALMMVMLLVVGAGINMVIIRDIVRYHRIGISEFRI